MLAFIIVPIYVLLVLMYSRKNDFSSNFIFLSLFFMGLFYLFPLLYFWEKDAIHYARVTRWYSEGDYNRAAAAFVLFLAGFFFVELLKVTRKKKRIEYEDGRAVDSKDASRKSSYFFFFLFLTASAAAVYFYINNTAEKTLLARQGEAVIGWGDYFLSVLMVSLSIFLFLFSIKNQKKAFIWLCLGLVLVSSVAIGGRTRLLLAISLMFLCLVNIRAKKISIIVMVLFIFMVPIVANLKTVMYMIIVHKDIPDIAGYYTNWSGLSKVMANFSHPVISIMNVDEMSRELGFRYFYDYLHGILFYLKVFGIDLGPSLTHFNTRTVIGIDESIIPTGYLAFGYMQLGYAGVFVSGFFYRMIGVLTKKAYHYTQLETESSKFYFSFMGAYSFYHGDIRIMVMTLFLPIVIIGALSSFHRNTILTR